MLPNVQNKKSIKTGTEFGNLIGW